MPIKRRQKERSKNQSIIEESITEESTRSNPEAKQEGITSASGIRSTAERQ